MVYLVIYRTTQGDVEVEYPDATFIPCKVLPMIKHENDENIFAIYDDIEDSHFGAVSAALKLTSVVYTLADMHSVFSCFGPEVWNVLMDLYEEGYVIMMINHKYCTRAPEKVKLSLFEKCMQWSSEIDLPSCTQVANADYEVTTQETFANKLNELYDGGLHFEDTGNEILVSHIR